MNGVTQFKYDANGNRESLTDSDNNVTTWTFDTFDRIVAEKNQLGDTRSVVYDTHGDLY